VATVRASLLVLLIAAACSDSSADPDPDADSLRIVDQSGGEFLWTADERVHRIAGVSPELVSCFEGEVSDYVAVGHRFFAVR
jgi:hypothetical protein